MSQKIRMTTVLFKKVDVNEGYLKVKKDSRKRSQHVFEDGIDNSVPRVTVWYHSAEPRDAR